MIEPYKDNLEYLSDQFERIGILRERIKSGYSRKLGDGWGGGATNKNLGEILIEIF